MLVDNILQCFKKPSRVEETDWRVNSLPNDKILDMTKLKAFADDKLNNAKMIIFLFDRLENTEGKGENAACQHFLPVFSKALFFRFVKSRDCVVKS